jgi:hypothetical protein
MSKLYVITRSDLELPYQGVQAGHAVSRWSRVNPDHLWWDNETMAYLVVDDESHLKRWCEKLKVRGYDFIEFHEPDIGNQLTAIACYSDDKIFRGLKKMREKENQKVA